VFWRSKVKVRESSKFAGERVLGAANDDGLKREFHGIKTRSRTLTPMRATDVRALGWL